MMTVNQKMMLIGLFLSKFDTDGLKALGFSRFWEAYNAFALLLGGPPKNINNYRDEFDPYFPNPRKGWHLRPLRPTRKAMMEKYAGLSLDEFAKLIRDITSPLGEVEEVAEKVESESFAKRMITGQSAEKYFEVHYQEVSCFKDALLTRTTAFGCGFDFKLEVSGTPYMAVEVKGLGAVNGSIQLTNKEYNIADYLKERYFLYVVRGFETPHPFFTVVRDPISSGLELKKHEIVSQQVTWFGNVTNDLISNCA